MTISDLIRLASNRAALLAHQRGLADHQGDVARLVELDAQIAQTQETLEKLHTLTD